MTSSQPLSRDALKAQAKRLRKALEAEGNFVSHGESLELLAHQMGYRDWNTLSAKAGNRPDTPLAVGGRVRGRYLGQAFEADIIGLRSIAGGNGGWRVSLNLDEAVDTVKFDGFSNLRRRISGTVNKDGRSVERTSDGTPHLQLSLR
ncbi:glyoxalase superfamily protein [Maricaulis sp.]|uniref:glyoxalase superfamily protein n=1 Tax=Maricaulis sp. TaxID=1486257 RepID=UPI002B27B34F|nr:glyoxalase superfamily protein [Maricaulis sp.]